MLSWFVILFGLGALTIDDRSRFSLAAAQPVSAVAPTEPREEAPELASGLTPTASPATLSATAPTQTPPPPPTSFVRARPARVLLDAGHGGSNPGARGPHLVEKHFTLGLARLIQRRLLAQGIETRLTRDEDQTMTLRERVELANGWPADVFVSLHGNASHSRTQRGVETYVLTARGVDVVGRALRSDAAAYRDAGIAPEVASMLDDVERGAAQWEAADLAAAVQTGLRKVRPTSGDRGVRQDAQHVLLGATMPAVLVEVGFIDHPVEGEELARPDVQSTLADAIAEAIRAQLPSVAAAP